MKKLITAIMFLTSLTIPVASKAQTVLIGVSGTLAYANANGSVSGELDIPYKKIEVDLADAYSPYEQHVGLGHGHANIAFISPILWLNNTGIQGKLEQSGYSVTSVRKSAIYASGGIIHRTYIGGVPSQIGLGYIQQVNNGILNGIETSQLHGGYISFDIRVGCAKNFCVRIQDQLSVGRVLEQGDPNCDGTYGPVTCGNRTAAFSGGGTIGIVLEFPRHKDTENSLF